MLEEQRKSFDSVTKKLPIACLYKEKPTAGFGIVSHNICTLLKHQHTDPVGRLCPSRQLVLMASDRGRGAFRRITPTCADLQANKILAIGEYWPSYKSLLIWS